MIFDLNKRVHVNIIAYQIFIFFDYHYKKYTIYDHSYVLIIRVIHDCWTCKKINYSNTLSLCKNCYRVSSGWCYRGPWYLHLFVLISLCVFKVTINLFRFDFILAFLEWVTNKNKFTISWVWFDVIFVIEEFEKCLKIDLWNRYGN